MPQKMKEPVSSKVKGEDSHFKLSSDLPHCRKWASAFRHINVCTHTRTHTKILNSNKTTGKGRCSVLTSGLFTCSYWLACRNTQTHKHIPKEFRIFTRNTNVKTFCTPILARGIKKLNGKRTNVRDNWSSLIIWPLSSTFYTELRKKHFVHDA